MDRGTVHKVIKSQSAPEYQRAMLSLTGVQVVSLRCSILKRTAGCLCSWVVRLCDILVHIIRC